jgi:hypothetical protein
LVHPKVLLLTEAVTVEFTEAVTEVLTEGVISVDGSRRDEEEEAGLLEAKLVESLGGVNSPPKELYCC